jgi:hypothetical protein
MSSPTSIPISRRWLALVAAGLGAMLLPMQPARPATTTDSRSERADQAA